MRIGIVADVHVGNHRVCGGVTEAGVNRRAREVADVLRRAVEKAVELGCKRFVIAGDLFDTSRPSPQVVRLVQEALDRRPGAPLPTFVLAGNHDIESSAEGDNALGPLKAIPSVHVVERPTAVALAHGTLMLIPFQPGDAREWIPRELEKLAGSLFPSSVGPGVLITHAGIIDEDTEAFLRKAHDAIEVDAIAAACGRAKVGHAFAGNWHTGRKWDHQSIAACVVQVGTLAPTGWDNPGSSGCGYGNLWIYDEASTPRADVVEIAGPRFHNVIRRGDVDLAACQQADGHSVYVRWKVGPDESLAEAQAYLNDLVTAGKLTAGIAVDDSGDAVAMARIAAQRAAAGAHAASGAGLDAVLAEFVTNMKIPEGVDREAVLAAARRFLAAG